LGLKKRYVGLSRRNKITKAGAFALCEGFGLRIIISSPPGDIWRLLNVLFVGKADGIISRKLELLRSASGAAGKADGIIRRYAKAPAFAFLFRRLRATFGN
jgi:hypothetical protein